MELLGSIIPTQEWELITLPSVSEGLVIDYSPMVPSLKDVRSLLLLRRCFVISGIVVRDKPFETLPKTDNEYIRWEPLSTNVKLLISQYFVELIKVYKPRNYDYIEPNWFIHVYSVP